MKQILFVLISAVVVFFATLVITNEYISRKAEESADKLNTRILDDYSNDINMSLLRSQKAVVSFLAGDFYSRYDTIKGKPRVSFYIREADKRDFKKTISESMKDFLAVNPTFHRALFVVYDSVSLANKQYGFYKNFAVFMAQGDKFLRKVPDHDFSKSPSFNQARTMRRSFWTVPSVNANNKDDFVMFYEPIFCEDGSFFGAFIINVDISIIHDMIKSHLPYGIDDSEILIRDGNDRIIASYPSVYEKYKTMENLRNNMENLHLPKVENKGGKYYSVENGQTYLYYKRRISIPDWTIITVCKKSAIYQDVDRIRWIIYTTSAVGMILMLICCIVVSRQIDRHMKEKNMAENELKMAANVQQSLLKPANLESDGVKLRSFMRPAREAGGDLYDYVEKNGKLIFCIGDVSGKGMGAALFMTQVVSLFRHSVSYMDKPELIVGQINNVLADNNPNMTFCTFFVGVLDKESHTVTFCNAGHNRPVVIPSLSSSASNPTVQEKPYYLSVKPNIALGLMSDYPFKSETLNLGQGDALLLYTDGVTEAKNASHELYGEERLLSLDFRHLTPESRSLTEFVVASVDEYVAGYEQSDDITVMELS